MKAILITTNDEVSIVDLQTGIQPLYKSINQTLKADLFESVHPKFLPQGIAMLVDESGRCKGLPINQYGSLLYGVHIHGEPIVGDILLMKEGFTQEGYDLVDFPEDELNEQFNRAKAVTANLKRFDQGMGGI